MSSVVIGFLASGLTLVLLALRVHIGVAMLVGGSVGYAAVSGVMPLMAYFKNLAYGRFSVYDLSVVPLFLLMGNIASKGGLSRRLFMAANAFLGHFRGGVAMSAIGACAAFGAICGSSLATAATMGQVALPELRRCKYSPALSTGALAAGGTLGILVPPSVILVIYAILAEQNVAHLFMAAMIPALIAMAGYMAAIAVSVRIDPTAGPAAEVVSWAERGRTLLRVWPIVMVFVVIIGGIYGGVFTPTEAAAIGVFATTILSILSGEFTLDGYLQSVLSAAEATAMIFLILLGADVLNAFLALSQMPAAIAQWVLTGGFPPLAVLFAMILVYVVLGCVMDSLSMILLTVPIFLPIILGLDFWGLDHGDKAIWFGILALMVVEIGLITPPVGMNVFIINSLARDVPMRETFRGVVPFLISDALRVVLLVFVPGLSLWLVRALG
ncbi:TRAP transporter large permease [Magnetospirillum sulfuroxidans]|uniref:TRAP transporter large permease protein n=1 Tax=Magnetospirillum sulfuroxidans TaxID=611300 RepID=A0ABS5IDK3_9PROT|nr:TRAP transporter large permease [Magnetospirillum sulfuroxidans]MBR9972480.1 TRAP transporter large permease [Magnetospirillum sulfuroxidans]